MTVYSNSLVETVTFDVVPRSFLPNLFFLFLFFLLLLFFLYANKSLKQGTISPQLPNLNWSFTPSLVMRWTVGSKSEFLF